MIHVVLKKGSDLKRFGSLLEDSGYAFTTYGSGRIFRVDTDFIAFTLHNYRDIASVETTKKMTIIPHLDTVIYSNIVTLPDSGPTIKPWGIHNIIRKYPAFGTGTRLIDRTYTKQWGCVRDGTGVDLYILDSGWYPSHNEYSGRVSRVSNGSTTETDIGTGGGNQFHATAVISCAAGNNIGIARGATIFYESLINGGFFTDAGYIEFYDNVYQHYLSRAHLNRPAVINNSFGNAVEGEPSAAFSAIIDDLIDAGMIIVISASNGRSDLDDVYVFPAEGDDDIVVVGSINEHGFPMYTRTSGTAVGSKVDIYAPGVNCVCANTDAPDSYYTLNGTSFASPYTAGVIACMLQGYQRLNNRSQVQSVANRLYANSIKGFVKIPPTYYGDSIINDRSLYLDPFKTIETIPGLTPL